MHSQAAMQMISEMHAFKHTHRLKCSIIFSSRTFSGKLPTHKCLVSRTILRGLISPEHADDCFGGGIKSDPSVCCAVLCVYVCTSLQKMLRCSESRRERLPSPLCSWKLKLVRARACSFVHYAALLVMRALRYLHEDAHCLQDNKVNNKILMCSKCCTMQHILFKYNHA